MIKQNLENENPVVSRTGFRNRFKFFDKDKDLKKRIRELAYKHKRAGYRQIHNFIRKG
ncbi:hypothetical protein MAL00_03775 [Leptospira noguchii]|nr:hypothetical protein [Leptospira noguchii]UOG49414.1 hypothetical protein MAL00_03775 [Leptospira noguchii]